jgi:hypothetical protein
MKHPDHGKARRRMPPRPSAAYEGFFQWQGGQAALPDLILGGRAGHKQAALVRGPDDGQSLTVVFGEALPKRFAR